MTITPRQKDSMMETLQAALQIVDELPTSTPCALCDHWESDTCKRWSATPPDDVRLKGCDEWVERVPF